MGTREECVFGCGRERRMHGKECRTCYIRLKVREWRAEQPDDVMKQDYTSIDLAINELDRKAHRDWLNNQ